MGVDAGDSGGTSSKSSSGSVTSGVGDVTSSTLSGRSLTSSHAGSSLLPSIVTRYERRESTAGVSTIGASGGFDHRTLAPDPCACACGGKKQMRKKRRKNTGQKRNFFGADGEAAAADVAGCGAFLQLSSSRYKTETHRLLIKTGGG